MKMANSDSEVTVLKNGGSGRSGSPITLNAPSNGGQASESSEDEREGRIRVGRDYQAVPPPFIPVSERRPEQCAERALLVWSPSSHITKQKLDEFIQVAKEKYGYNSEEQALGMLFWHKHDIDCALQDLANFTPFPDEWSAGDKELFEQAFLQFHGKFFRQDSRQESCRFFHSIRQMLPEKSIAALDTNLFDGQSGTEAGSGERGRRTAWRGDLPPRAWGQGGGERGGANHRCDRRLGFTPSFLIGSSGTALSPPRGCTSTTTIWWSWPPAHRSRERLFYGLQTERSSVTSVWYRTTNSSCPVFAGELGIRGRKWSPTGFLTLAVGSMQGPTATMLLPTAASARGNNCQKISLKSEN